MNPELAACHEAGHAVAQWLVGWEVQYIEMVIVAKEAKLPQASCPKPSLTTKSNLKKRLLVLFAGTSATQEKWPGSTNNRNDWYSALGALREHFGREIKWVPTDGMRLRDDAANELVASVLQRATELSTYPPIRDAIGEVAHRLSTAPSNENGLKRLQGHEIVSVCESIVGTQFRVCNPWSDWLDTD